MSHTNASGTSSVGRFLQRHLGAHLIIECCGGVGFARLGSAVLMAANPDRFTVMDTRTIKTIGALGLPGARFANRLGMA